MKRSGIETVPTAAAHGASQSISAFLQHSAASLVQASGFVEWNESQVPRNDQRQNAHPGKFH
ncbi:hypothetical protein [Phytopseudomonas daroniae]|uniref:hypothetical protein n=1 Tax=Phytopseudomonas daroniae TaxID=2487519 RepID=UPI0010383515|nr:hypothetical protein [Pseudomonas daroniae]TBU72268.1 hypothetical protein DNK10_22250 [Pseudomonas daroniae]